MNLEKEDFPRVDW